MKDKVYILIDVNQVACRQVVRTLRRQPGVVLADVLEDQSRVMLLVTAESRLELAELTNRALVSVEDLIFGIHLLPTSRENPSDASRRRPPASRPRVACLA